MYDLSSKFNIFYTSYVVLLQDEQNNLHNKKDLNVQRLKDGLKEYNIENNTSYTIAETCVQGSVAMSTVVQNEDGDYDIDVAVVFDKNVLGDKGAQATRNLVANVEERAVERYEVLIEQLSQREGVSEKLKEENQMEWVRRMRNLENRAAEIVKAELIYTFERR